LRGKFEQLARERNIGRRVHFAGDVSDAALPRYYRAADIHVLPSTARSEAFGLVSLEAAASGIPTVTSDLPGVRTVVIDGETGIRVPPGNPQSLRQALARLIDDADLRKYLGTGARRRATAQYSWDPLIARLEETYRSARLTRAVRRSVASV